MRIKRSPSGSVGAMYYALCSLLSHVCEINLMHNKKTLSLQISSPRAGCVVTIQMLPNQTRYFNSLIENEVGTISSAGLVASAFLICHLSFTFLIWYTFELKE